MADLSSSFQGDQLSTQDGVASFDVLEASAADLQALMNSKSITAVDIVHRYLDQIEAHNINDMGLRAIISVAPSELVLARARELDAERSAQGPRGPLHGIPFIVKDTYMTVPSMGMDTTCGTLALKDAKPKHNAEIVDLLLKAGAIILGKANLSELALMKGSPPLVGGWSSAGGQTPCGSSSGSAAGVSVGFAPIGIGHETDGSIVQAATRAGLYALKPDVGTVPLKGTMVVCKSFDVHGGIARTVKDLADVTSVLTGGKDFSSYLTGSLKGIRLGFVVKDVWQPASFVVETNEGFKQQTYAAVEDAMTKIRSAGGSVVRDVPLITLSDLAKEPGGDDPDNMYGHDFKNNLEDFLQQYDTAPIRNLQQMIDYHRTHADQCLPPAHEDHPSQGCLESFTNKVPDPDFDRKLQILRGKAQSSITLMLKEHKIDAVLGLADGRMASVAAMAGWSVGSLPLGYADFNGRAFGLNIIVGGSNEGKMLEIMSGWENAFPEARAAPPMLINWGKGDKTVSSL